MELKCVELHVDVEFLREDGGCRAADGQVHVVTAAEQHFEQPDCVGSTACAGQGENERWRIERHGGHFTPTYKVATPNVNVVARASRSPAARMRSSSASPEGNSLTLAGR